MHRRRIKSTLSDEYRQPDSRIEGSLPSSRSWLTGSFNIFVFVLVVAEVPRNRSLRASLVLSAVLRHV
jgi:hypothetical protein